MQIQKLKLADLAPNTGQIPGLPINPRQWTKGDVDKIAASLKETPELFEARPVLVVPHDGKYVILGGNLRYEGARQNKEKEVPAIIFPEDTPIDKMKEIVVKDNGSFGAWDYDALANEWDDLPLSDWGVPAWETEDLPPVNADASEDEFDEDTDEAPTRCKAGDIWELGAHRLMCGDSTNAAQVELLMNGEKADMVLTDPPYGTTAISWDKPIDLDAFFKCIYQNSKENAAISVFGAQPFVTDMINASRKTFRYEIIWEKTMKSMFLSVNKCPLRTHENIVVFYKKQPVFNPQKYEVEERPRVRHVDAIKSKQYHFAGEHTYTNDGTRFYGDVLHFSSWNGALFGNNENATKHPTQKPVELIAHLEKMYTNPDDSILDLFGGSGTTLIAAEQLGRKCFMMELDPHYCDIILARWEKLTGQTATKI